MDNNLILSTELDSSKLDRRNFTLSLSGELLELGMLSESEFNRLQAALMEHLSRRIELYTGGESTSVKNETAEKLFRSAMYNLDLALLHISDTRGDAEAAKRLIQIARRGVEGFESLGYDGLRLNRELQLKARSMLRKLKATRIRTDCIAYNILLNKTLDELIRGYDDKFDAASVVKVGYPMPTLRTRLRGVSGIIRLLTELECEREYLRSFPENELAALNKQFERTLLDTYSVGVNLGALCTLNGMLSLMSGDERPSLPFDTRKLSELIKRADEMGDAYSLYVSCEHRLAAQVVPSSNAVSRKALSTYLEKLSALIRVEIANAYRGGEYALARLIEG